MKYEKELEYLRKEFKKSSAKFHQAEAEGYETDAEIWEDDTVNIGHQIHIHEQAAKADEYEAKAKAFDEIFKLYTNYEDGWSHLPKGRMSFYKEIISVCKEYESGDSDEV